MENENLARNLRDAIASSIWQNPPVDEEPVIRLSEGQVVDVSGELRVVG